MDMIANYFKMFFRRIYKDLKQKELLPLKFLFFMHSSTILVLYPYLTIHMRELGINVEETATMSAVTPVIALLMAPLAGLMADKIGNFRYMLAFFSSIGGLSALLLLLVPVGRSTVMYPDRLVFGMACSANSPLTLSLYQQHTCMPLAALNDTQFKLESCGYACQAVLNENHTNTILNATTYGLQLHNIGLNDTKVFTFNHTGGDLLHPLIKSERLNRQILFNDERYASAVRKIGKNSFFFPTPGLYNFSCDSSTKTCAFGPRSLSGFPTKYLTSFNGTIKPVDVDRDDILEKRQFYEFTHETNCLPPNNYRNEYVSLTIALPDVGSVKHLDLGSCAPRCLVTAPRKNVCSNDALKIEYNVSLTFWSYLTIRVFIGIVSGTAFAMFEGAVIAILREHKADYGLQRIYATIGGMISSPLAGVLIDWASSMRGYTNFTPIFFLYAILKVISGILMLFINLEFKKPAKSIISDVVKVLKTPELISLFIAILILGCSWGYIESFLFWLVQDLGGTKTLMGLTITVAGLIGIPLLVLSGPIIKKLGHANVIFIGFAFYALRLIGYSIIYNPWLCLIFEAMEAITFGLSFTAAVTYAAKLSTPSTDTTIQALLGGLHFAVGKGIGSLIGGYLIKLYGIRATFKIFSVFTIVSGFLYLATFHLFIKKKDDVKNEKHAEELPDQIHDVPTLYEDALTNPAFEDTEFEKKAPSDDDEQRA